MKSIIPYIVFQGNCKEAMEFYAKVFQGNITFMYTFENSQVSTAQEYKDRIFNSELKAENIHIKASDDLPNHQITIGTNISLYIVFDSKQEKKEAFKNLSKDGKILFPIDDNFGMLKDKYGVQWMFVDESE